jgi:hypothetical protein
MVVQNKSGTVQVRKMLNGTTLDPTQDGNDVPGATAETFISGQEQPNNLLVEAFGKRFLTINDTIRERNEGGDGNWGIVHSFTTNERPRVRSGIHLLHPAGIPTVAVIYSETTDNIRLITSTDGTVWSDIQIAGQIAGNIDEWGRSVVFGSNLYWIYKNSSGPEGRIICRDLELGVTTLFDLDAGVFTGLTIEDNVAYADWIVHKDKLYIIIKDNTSNGYLFRLDGSAWVNAMGGTSTFTTGWTTGTPASALISDGDDLVAFITTSAAVRAYRFQTPETTATSSNITAPVWNNVSTNGQSHFHKYLDVSDPTSATWYIWQGTGGSIISGTFDCYQYKGIGMTMDFVGNGIAANAFTIPSIGDGGNDRIPTATSGRPEFDSQPEEVVAGRRRFFRVYGTGADINLRQYHNLGREAPDILSTLGAGTIEVNDSIDVTGLVGNASETTLEGLTPSAGDAYVVSAENGDGTLNPGAVVIRVGDIVKYNGTIWQMVQSTTTLGSNLEAYWKLNDDGLDETTNNRDWTFTGVEGYNTGLFQNGYEVLGASGRYATQSGHDPIFDLPQLEPWAMSLWVNVDALATTQALLSKGDGTLGGGSADGWTLRIGTDGHVRFVHHQNGVNHSTSAGLITAGAGMQHIVVTNDGVTEKIYIDNIERASNPSAVSFTGQTAALYMGNIVVGTNPLDGVIDEVSFWSKALSSADVARLYNGGAGQGLGFPDFGVHVTLNNSTALISPYTDGADDGKTVSFDGTNLDGTVLTLPTNTSSQITGITPDNGATQYRYLHLTGTDSITEGTTHSVILDTL